MTDLTQDTDRTTAPDDGPPATVTVSVRYFAGAAAAAGVDEERLSVPGESTVGDVLERVSAARGADLARVVAGSSFLLDATAAVRGDVVLTGATLDVLPPFAGG